MRIRVIADHKSLADIPPAPFGNTSFPANAQAELARLGMTDSDTTYEHGYPIYGNVPDDAAINLIRSQSWVESVTVLGEPPHGAVQG